MEAHGCFRFHDLEGRRLAVTGITSGIGRALLPGLLDQGLRLVGIGKPMHEMRQVCLDLGVDESRLALVECDLADPASVARATGKLAALPPLYGFLHNAGIDRRMPFATTERAQWAEIFEVNLFSGMELVRSVIPGMQEAGEGRVLFTGSVMDTLGGSFLTAYTASKAALHGLTRSLAHELQGSGITVNCLVPGSIQVEREVRMGDQQARNKRFAAWQGVTRRLTPLDLLGPLCLLLSKAGEGVNGQSLPVDGGLMHPLATVEMQRINMES